MAVEVILRDDVPSLGTIGQVVRVKPGYARNYLLPRGLAVEASRTNLAELAHQKRVIAVKAERDRKAAEGVAARLQGLALTIAARAGEEGRLFGSVTNMDIERALAANGVAVDRRRIVLPEPIKQIGTHEVSIQIGRDVRATISVTIKPETE